MKFPSTLALALLPFVIANPLANPAPAPGLLDPVPYTGEDGDVGSLDKRQGQSCYVSGLTGARAGYHGPGTCRLDDINNCRYVSVSGFCPAPANNRCCRQIACSGQYSGWTCRNTYKGCSGKFVTGYCPGLSDVKCCVP